MENLNCFSQIPCTDLAKSSELLELFQNRSLLFIVYIEGGIVNPQYCACVHVVFNLNAVSTPSECGIISVTKEPV